MNNSIPDPITEQYTIELGSQRFDQVLEPRKKKTRKSEKYKKPHKIKDYNKPPPSKVKVDPTHRLIFSDYTDINRRNFNNMVHQRIQSDSL